MMEITDSKEMNVLKGLIGKELKSLGCDNRRVLEIGVLINKHQREAEKNLLLELIGHDSEETIYFIDEKLKFAEEMINSDWEKELEETLDVANQEDKINE